MIHPPGDLFHLGLAWIQRVQAQVRAAGQTDIVVAQLKSGAAGGGNLDLIARAEFSPGNEFARRATADERGGHGIACQVRRFAHREDAAAEDQGGNGHRSRHAGGEVPRGHHARRDMPAHRWLEGGQLARIVGFAAELGRLWTLERLEVPTKRLNGVPALAGNRRTSGVGGSNPALAGNSRTHEFVIGPDVQGLEVSELVRQAAIVAGKWAGRVAPVEEALRSIERPAGRGRQAGRAIVRRSGSEQAAARRQHSQ